MATRVLFYYDVVSPWSLFAYAILKRYQKPWNLNLVLKPVFLGGIMAGSGNKPPITVVNKGKHMKDDMVLTGAYFGVGYKYPPVFPINTIAIVRFLRVLEDKDPAMLIPATDAFYAAVWGPNATDPEGAAKVTGFAKVLGSLFSEARLKELVELSAGNENKDKVKADAAFIVEQGAFGAPWMVVERADGTKANFFGSDRFEVMANFLGKKWDGPFPAGQARL